MQLADEHNFPLLADEVYADLAFDGPVGALAALNPEAPVITFSVAVEGVSGARLAGGLDGVAGTRDWTICSRGSRSWRTDVCAAPARWNMRSSRPQRGSVAPGSFRDALRERAEITSDRLNAIDGITVVPPRAAFYAMPKVALPPGVTDEDYVLGSAAGDRRALRLRIGFGTAPADGFFRVVFLASPAELSGIYGLIADFTSDFLARRERR